MIIKQRKEKKERERDYRYTAVMRSLVWRYISAMQRAQDEAPVTEDDVNEIKGEISSMKCELLNVLEKNGMDVSLADRKEKSKYYFNVVANECDYIQSVSCTSSNHVNGRIHIPSFFNFLSCSR